MNAAINAKNTEDNNILIFHFKINVKFGVKPTQWREVSRLNKYLFWLCQSGAGQHRANTLLSQNHRKQRRLWVPVWRQGYLRLFRNLACSSPLGNSVSPPIFGPVFSWKIENSWIRNGSILFVWVTKISHHANAIPLAFHPAPIWRGHSYWNRKDGIYSAWGTGPHTYRQTPQEFPHSSRSWYRWHIYYRLCSNATENTHASDWRNGFQLCNVSQTHQR